MFGYTGKVLHLDMTTKKSRIEPVTEEFCRKYIGGVGFVARLLYDSTKPKIDPLSPDSVLIFATGPFGGTLVPVGNKHAVGGKSPLTGFIGDSLSSSFWSHELKKAGYDALIITGRADKYTYLFIDDDTVEFRNGEALRGKSCLDAEKLIREELEDRNIRVASIGIAGENLVRYANISNDRRHAGRTGLGAVMGSKNLKAIALRGTKTVRVADLDELTRICLDLYERAQGPPTEKYRVLGTPTNVLVFNRLACLPTRNFQQATFEGAEKVSGEYMLEHHVTKVSACASCPIACDHYSFVNEGPYAGAATSLDYESMFALGPNCGVDDSPAIIKALELCDYYGLDTISTGGVIGWAMECFEKGLLTVKDTGGIELTFGNHRALVQLIHKIASREGIGDLLAQGVKRASEKLGEGSELFAMHIKGLELPGYDIRGLKTAALGFAVAARGACHNRSGAYDYDIGGEVDRFRAEKGRGKLAMESEDSAAIFDSLMLCKFIRRCFKDFYDEAAELYEVVTGLEMKANQLREAGERIVNLKKAYNVREGWTCKDDRLPPRIMKDPIPDGVAKGSLVTPNELDLMLNDYYEARGWTEDGFPSKAKLIELELDDIAKEIGDERRAEQVYCL